jgi:hypothetical protein
LIQGLENHRRNRAGVGSLETGNEAESGLEIRMEKKKIVGIMSTKYRS